MLSHSTVIFPGGVVKTTAGAGVIVIVLETGIRILPHGSVAVHVSVIVPPQTPGNELKVDNSDIPLTRHDPLCEFVYVIVPGLGTNPQPTVMSAGAVNIGSGAGVIVIVLFPLIVRLHSSVNVQLSVNIPPQPVTVPVLTAVTVPDIMQVPEPAFE